MLTRGPMALAMEDMTTWRPRGGGGQLLSFYIKMGEKEILYDPSKCLMHSLCIQVSIIFNKQL